ncbi:hypothetical protein CBOM_01456 [Ceraceosorus bombacis]|uniref:Uncharacterized protein n=1 Tax=Ceraceosorus bombacis TaxID=401625 RepID=A0A0P1BCM9_9BASI|nr:hypothetical protein CBOM_01456 [Ceraceosorus bombacis]
MCSSLLLRLTSLSARSVASVPVGVGSFAEGHRRQQETLKAAAHKADQVHPDKSATGATTADKHDPDELKKRIMDRRNVNLSGQTFVLQKRLASGRAMRKVLLENLKIVRRPNATRTARRMHRQLSRLESNRQLLQEARLGGGKDDDRVKKGIKLALATGAVTGVGVASYQGGKALASHQHFVDVTRCESGSSESGCNSFRATGKP